MIVLVLLLHAALCVLALQLTADRTERWPFLASLVALPGSTLALNVWVLIDAARPPTSPSPDQAEIGGITGILGPLIAPMFGGGFFIVAGLITAAVYAARQYKRQTMTPLR